jgi:hypothetical protein
MATLSRNQVVLRALQGEGTGDAMINTTLQVTKTATMTHGTLLKADFTEAADADITAGDVVYVIDDFLIDAVATGDEATVRAVVELDWVIFRAEELKVGNTPLSEAQLTAFGKKTQASHEVLV